MRFAVLFLSISLLIGVSSGCGGGSSGSTDSDNTALLTRAQFIEHAENICNRGDSTLLPLISSYLKNHPPRAGQSEGEVEAEGTRKVLLPKFEIEVDELRLLKPPAEDKQQIEAFLDAMQHAIDSLNNRGSISVSTDLDREFQKAGELALDYGITGCAN